MIINRRSSGDLETSGRRALPEGEGFAEVPALPASSYQRTDSYKNPALVYLASLAPGSRRTMTDALATIAGILTNDQAGIESLPWRELRYPHTMAVRAVLAQKYSFATANKMLSALRGTLKAAWRLEQMTAEEYQRAIDVPRIQGETLPAGRSLSIGEIVALMDVCRRDKKPAGARDAAILSLLYGCGLRRAEAATLLVSDYNPTEGTLKILGKRNKQRLVPVVGGAANALNAWLAVRGDTPGALFVATKKGGKLRLAPNRKPHTTDHGPLYGQTPVSAPPTTDIPGMTAQAIYLLLLERAQQAGVPPFSPHDFRRTFVGDLLDRGADIATVQKLAGHANVTTTARYDRRGETAKRKAAELLHVPYG